MLVLKLSLMISLASLGFRAITGKNMIFYFLRQPFDKLSQRKSRIQEDLENGHSAAALVRKKRDEYESTTMEWHQCNTDLDNVMAKMEACGNPKKYDWLLYCMKPVLLCSTCMASLHTIIWFPFLNGSYSWSIIMVMLIVALLNTLIWSLIELIQKHS